MGFTDRNFFLVIRHYHLLAEFYTCKWLARKYTELGGLKTIKQITRCTFSYPQAGWERLQLPEQSPEFNGWLGLCCWPAGIRSPHVARLPWKQVTASWFYLERNGEDIDPNSRFSHGVQLVECVFSTLLLQVVGLSVSQTIEDLALLYLSTIQALAVSFPLSTLQADFLSASVSAPWPLCLLCLFFGFSSVHVIFSRPWKTQDMISGPSSCVGGWAKTPFLYRSMRMQQVSA